MGSGSQELLHFQAGFRGWEGGGGLQDERQETPEEDFIYDLEGVVSEKKERGFKHAAGEIKASHGEGLSHAKTPERRWKLGGEMWCVFTGGREGN